MVLIVFQCEEWQAKRRHSTKQLGFFNRLFLVETRSHIDVAGHQVRNVIMAFCSILGSRIFRITYVLMKLSVQILLAFGIVILLSIADSITNYTLSRKVQLNSQFLSNSEAIIRNSNKTHKVIIDMQSSFRGFLLTDDTTFLKAYYNGTESVPVFLDEQKRLVGNNKRQLGLLNKIAQTHASWVDYSGQLIRSRQTMPAAYQQLFETRLKKQVGKRMNDQISLLFSRFDRIEYAARKRHSVILMRSISTTHTISLTFLGLTIIAGLCSTLYIVMLITKRIASMVRLAENISSGRFTVVRDTRNDELTSLARSLNIMSRNLDQTIRELRRRNAELNQFAYVVSHDLKAPVRGIHNVTTWIEEDLAEELSPELKKYLAIIPERTRRMEALINGLLDYARISHKMPPEKVDTNELVRGLVDSLVPRTFTITIDRLPELYTERIKLEQVFSNLISNAVKYTPDPNGIISITCRDFPAFYSFSVKDNGVGIDPVYHEKIFEIFQTLREKNATESTGVGLAIVKKIIDEQQESISVRSQLGEGAEFTFTWRKIQHEETHDFTR
jgi:signal transduction histidine kinase